MRNSELHALLKRLEKSEFKKFGDFVKSPYFKIPAQAQRLYSFIAKYYPDLEHDCFSDYQPMLAYLYEKEKDRKPNKARSVIAKLKKALEQFLVQEVLGTDEVQQNKLLIRAYEEKGADRYFERKVEDRIKKLEGSRKRSLDFYAEMEWHYERVFLHPETAIYNFKESILPQLLDHLDQYYLLKKLRYGCEILHQSAYLRSDYHLLFWDEISDLVQEKMHQGDPLFKFYHIYLHLSQEKQVDQLETCLEAFEQIADQLTQLDEAFVIKNLINLLIREISKGNSYHATSALKLYQRIIDRKYLLQSGRLRVGTFLNITTIGCLAREFAWTEDFIGQYRDCLDPAKKDVAVNYALAYLSFNRGIANEDAAGHYETAIELLALLHPTDIYFSLRIRSLLLMISMNYHYLIKEDKKLLGSQVESFLKFLQRKASAIPSERIQSYRHFVKSTDKIYKACEKYSGEQLMQKLTRLKKQVMDLEHCVHKALLIITIDGLL